MTSESARRETLAAVMHGINQAWLHGQLDELASMLHAEAVMAIPGFSGSVQGRETLLHGFREFLESSTIHDFHEQDYLIDVAGNTGVITFRYEMQYERSGERYRATGRDLWVFESANGTWLAVWRTMLELEENAVPST